MDISNQILEEKKLLYPYQINDVDKIFQILHEKQHNYHLLYQLPTGGGKTVIFSEITRRFIAEFNENVLVLTHRIELCKQTSKMLKHFNVKNKIINSEIKIADEEKEINCYVAMVETLSNRLNDDKFKIKNIGLVIIDEAHFNSFTKIFKYYENCFFLGVTATPLSSNIKEPMYKNYNTLITGSSIHELIQNNYLSRPNYTHYNIGLGMLKVGANGDYTVKSSDELYASEDMLNKTLKAYYETSLNKKTLIFNNGIKTSLEVYETLKKANLPVKHLDHSFTSEERKDILKWFKHTPNAIISSVSILTTGFDEPTIESIILNRATRSIALYFQMIGRGSRLLPNKNNFQITDLGNNIVRFGFWHDPVDWHYIFKYPEYFIQNIKNDKEIEEQFSYEMTQETKSFFPNTTNFEFNIVKEYQQALKKFLKTKTVIDKSVDQHVDIIFENADNFQTARKLIEILKDEIEFRVRQYTHQLGNTTFNYRNWLIEDYHLKLRQKLNAKYRELALKE